MLIFTLGTHLFSHFLHRLSFLLKKSPKTKHQSVNEHLFRMFYWSRTGIQTLPIILPTSCKKIIIRKHITSVFTLLDCSKTIYIKLLVHSTFTNIWKAKILDVMFAIPGECIKKWHNTVNVYKSAIPTCRIFFLLFRAWGGGWSGWHSAHPQTGLCCSPCWGGRGRDGNDSALGCPQRKMECSDIPASPSPEKCNITYKKIHVNAGLFGNGQKNWNVYRNATEDFTFTRIKCRLNVFYYYFWHK